MLRYFGDCNAKISWICLNCWDLEDHRGAGCLNRIIQKKIAASLQAHMLQNETVELIMV